LINCVVNSYC